MITARHCGDGGWDWFTPIGDRLVGTAGNGQSDIDATVLLGSNYRPSIYVGAWDRDPGITRTVIGAANPSDESYVFSSGSFSGAHTLRVKSVGQYINISGVVIGPGFWTRDEENDGSVGQGDSGGATAGPGSVITEVRARGMIDAIDTATEAACEGRDDGRRCAYRAFHVNIGAILDQMNLTIQKG